MSRLRVLLVCGSGASSTFMAMAMRRVIVEHHLDIEVSARSEAEIENYIEDIDVVMVGPHLSVWYDDLKQQYGCQIKVLLIENSIYANLNGDAAVDQLIRETGWK